MDGTFPALCGLRNPAKIDPAVVFSEEDRLAIVTPLNDMGWYAGNEKPLLARHRRGDPSEVLIKGYHALKALTLSIISGHRCSDGREL